MTKKRKKPTRRQHLIPASYLARFTIEGYRDSSLQVFDVQRRKFRPSTPDATAHQRFFYAVEGIPGIERNYVEDRLAICEGKWAEALTQVIAAGSLVSNDIYTDVMFFAAFLAVRHRRFRDRIADFVNRSERAQLSTSIATSNGWEQFRSIAIRAIESEGRHVTRAEREVLDDPNGFRQFVNTGAVVDYDQTWHVQLMIKCALGLAFTLGERHWTVWTIDESGPEFVCSDSPVCLTWKGLNQQLWSPGFGQTDTWVTLPLSRRLAIVGSYEPQTEHHTASVDEIAWLNSLTARYASEIYGTDLSAWTT